MAPARLRDAAGMRAGASIRAMYEHWSDESLVERWSDTRDETAFRTLYMRHKTGMYRYLLRTVRTPEHAQDILQEAWSRLCDAIERGKYSARDDASFKTFLYTLANNCRADFYRRTRLKLVQADADPGDDDPVPLHERAPDPGPRPDQSLERERLLQAYARALAALPDTQRQAFLLQEDGGLGVKEIAEVMGVPFETAKSYLRYARDKLRSQLQAWHEQR
jgi:RNA polymerase sigma-70 factor (ECF subfamily)